MPTHLSSGGRAANASNPPTHQLKTGVISWEKWEHCADTKKTLHVKKMETYLWKWSVVACRLLEKDLHLFHFNALVGWAEGRFAVLDRGGLGAASGGAAVVGGLRVMIRGRGSWGRGDAGGCWRREGRSRRGKHSGRCGHKVSVTHCHVSPTGAVNVAGTVVTGSHCAHRQTEVRCSCSWWWLMHFRCCCCSWAVLLLMMMIFCTVQHWHTSANVLLCCL